MPKQKTILFLTHHNNDFDHFLPIILRLRKEKKINVKILAFYNNVDILKNKLHKHICDSNNLKLDSMTNIAHLKNINLLITKIYNYVISNTKAANQSTFSAAASRFCLSKIKRRENAKRSTVYRFLHRILLRYFMLHSIFLLTEKKIAKYLRANKVDLIIIDHRAIDESAFKPRAIARFLGVATRKIDPLNLAMFRFAKKLRERKKPILMIPHGPQPILARVFHERFKYLKNTFRPDFLILGNVNEQPLSKDIWPKNQNSICFLGDPRFDIDWIAYLESCALKVYGTSIKKPKNKKVLLYLMDIFTYDPMNRQAYALELQKDVVSLANEFSDLEIWIKHHPRHVFDLPVDEFIRKDRQKNIKQFGNDTDTNILLAKADIVLALSSTMLIAPIAQKKPVIFYDKWKEKLPRVECIYDGIKSSAATKKELATQYKKISEGKYKITDSYINSLYKNVFSASSLSESMTDKYIEKIKEILFN